MGVEVEYPGGIRARAHAQDHVAQLADGRVGQHLLDVGLGEGDQGGEEGRGRADHRDDGLGCRSLVVQDVGAGDHVDARRHHRRGVDQRRDGRGAGHGVGQPDVEGYLGRLANGSDEQQQRNRRDHRRANGQPLGRREHIGEVKAAEGDKNKHDAQREAKVADTVDDKRFATGRGVVGVGEPERDEQKGAEANQFPPHEEQQIVRAQHQDEHRDDKQVQVGKEAGIARVVGHVAHGVEVDQEANARDDEQHQARQRVHQELHGDDKVTRPNPLEEGDGELLVFPLQPVQPQDDDDRHQKGQGHDARPKQAHDAPTQAVAPQAVDDDAQQGEENNQRDEVFHKAWPFSA